MLHPTLAKPDKILIISVDDHIKKIYKHAASGTAILIEFIQKNCDADLN